MVSPSTLEFWTMPPLLVGAAPDFASQFGLSDPISVETAFAFAGSTVGVGMFTVGVEGSSSLLQDQKSAALRKRMNIFFIAADFIH